jgi:diacylglycerol kinase family enzyme
VRTRRNLALEIDGRPAGTAREITVEVLPAALRLLI